MRAHILLLTLSFTALAGPDWPHYAGGPEQNRYSPLTQITRGKRSLAEGRVDVRH